MSRTRREYLVLIRHPFCRIATQRENAENEYSLSHNALSDIVCLIELRETTILPTHDSIELRALYENVNEYKRIDYVSRQAIITTLS